MNIKQQLKRDTKRLFKSLDRSGLASVITYKQLLSTEYDVAKGKDIEKYNTITVRAFIDEYNKREVSDTIRITDVKALVLKSDVTYAINDIVVLNGLDYTVINAIDNPVTPTVELQLRAD